MGIKVEFSEIKNLQKMIEGIQGANRDSFMKETTNELASRVLEKVIFRTPVRAGTFEADVAKIGKDGKVKRYKRNNKKRNIQKGQAKVQTATFRIGGTLRRGWNIIPAKIQGDDCIAEVVNPVHYAPYVENGHRQRPGRFVPAIGKRLKAGFVKGQFMLTKSLSEVDQIKGRVISAKLRKYMEKGGFDAK